MSVRRSRLASRRGRLNALPARRDVWGPRAGTDPPEQAAAWEFCWGILPSVSRSFALIIPCCPPPLDHSLCAAYLLCRVADTVEDDAALDQPAREQLFDRFLACIDEPAGPPTDLPARSASDGQNRARSASEGFLHAWPALPGGDYGRLIRGLNRVLQAYGSLPAECRAPIRRCVHEMVAGMRGLRPIEERDGVRFFCRDLADLDQYCHYVAGTVGLMSSRLFELHLRGTGLQPLIAPEDSDTAYLLSAAWREDGRRMGLGLQLTNVIKDFRVDAQRGVSFIPPGFVEIVGGHAALTPQGRPALLRHAAQHLDAAMRYTLAIPPAETGIRTFLLGSIFPAVATLQVAGATSKALQPKITRRQMAEILATVTRHVSDDAQLQAWYAGQRQQLA